MNTITSEQNLAGFSASIVRLIDGLGVVMLLAMPLLTFLGIALCDIALSSIAGLFVLRSLFTREFAWLKTNWVILGLLLWAYLLLISPFVFSPKHSFDQAVPFGRFVLFAAGLQFWLLKSKQHRQWLLNVLGATLIFIVINTFWTYLSGVNVLGGESLWSSGGHTGFYWIWHRIAHNGAYMRLVGLNHKPNSGTILMWACFPFVGAMLARIAEQQGAKKIWAAVAVLSIILAVMLSGERTAFLELGLGFVFLFCLIKPLRKTLIKLGLTGLVMIGLAMLVDHNLWHRDVLTVYNQIGAVGHNVYGSILATALAMFKSHPWFGVGLKQYQSLCSQPPYAIYNGCNTHPQNLYLEWLSGTGMIGTVLFLGILGCWLTRFWRERKVIALLPVAGAAMVGMLVRAWPIASTTSFFFSWGAISFWWMGAWVLAVLDDKKREANA